MTTQTPIYPKPPTPLMPPPKQIPPLPPIIPRPYDPTRKSRKDHHPHLTSSTLMEQIIHKYRKAAFLSYQTIVHLNHFLLTDDTRLIFKYKAY